MTDYIELHARSAFSFLEGASVPEEFAAACAAQQMPAMALLDRDGVYGAPRFYFAAKKLNLKAHIGAEITSLLSSISTGAPLDKVEKETPSGAPSRLPLPGWGVSGAPSKPSFGSDRSFCSVPTNHDLLPGRNLHSL